MSVVGLDEVFPVGTRVRGRFTDRPGIVAKTVPAGCYVRFDDNEDVYPVVLHPALHLKPFYPPGVYAEIAAELVRAREKHPGKQNSPHEGWAVLQEEADELWDEVKGNGSRRHMREEAIQIAAMAVRFIEDLCEPQQASPLPGEEGRGTK